MTGLRFGSVLLCQWEGCDHDANAIWMGPDWIEARCAAHQPPPPDGEDHMLLVRDVFDRSFVGELAAHVRKQSAEYGRDDWERLEQWLGLRIML